MYLSLFEIPQSLAILETVTGLSPLMTLTLTLFSLKKFKVPFADSRI
jgi:hypothetical protein